VLDELDELFMCTELLAEEYCWKELNSLVSSRIEKTHA